MENSYTIYPLRVGTLLRPKDNSPGATDLTLSEDPIIAYYIEGNGHKIMVDTGGPAPDGIRWLPYWRNRGETVPEALRELGVDISEIDTVILTHMHWDHGGNTHLFNNAEFYIQKREFDYWSKPENNENSDFEGSTVFNPSYHFLDGDTEILPGISVILAAGHSPGMQCVIVDTEEGKYSILGDLIIRFFHWEEEPRLLIDLGFDTETYNSFVEKVDAIGGKILPGHDPDVFTRQRTYPAK